MLTVKEYRRRGFQYRRVSFAFKVIAGAWSIAMIGIFVTSPTAIGFFAMLAGVVCFVLPSLLLATVFDDRAERNFNLAAAHKQVAVLGVVQPRN